MSAREENLAAILAQALEQVLGLLRMKAGFLETLGADDDVSPAFVMRGFSPAAASVVRQLCRMPAEGQERAAPRAPLLYDASGKNARDSRAADLLRSEGLSFLALVPLVCGGQLVGALGLADRGRRTFSGERREFLDALAAVLAEAIAGARLRDTARKLSEDLTALQELNKIISQHIDLGEIIQRLVIEGRRLVKTEHCHFFLLDDRSRRLVGSASTQTGDPDIRTVEIDPSEDSVAHRAIREKRVIVVERLASCGGFNRGLCAKLHWHSAIFAPLVAKEAIGILVCSDNQRERSFSREEVLRAETLAHQGAIAMENARLFQVVSRSQKEWETTFDAMQDCVSVHDTTGRLVRANRALARRLKTVPQQLIGKTCAEIYTPGELRFDPCRHMQSLEAEGLIVEEVGLPHMGGTFQLSVSPWYDKNNRLVGSIHVAKDVSHEKLLQQQLIQSEKLSAIGELISGIAHELNNPLTGVMGYSQLLQMRKDIDERARESLIKINSLALRCQKIVKNLLSFARRQKPERTLTNVNDILERTLELRNYELAVNNIAIVRELDRNLPETIADAHQLQQVFLNIITNAEQAMLEAHGKGRLTVRSRAESQNRRIVVEIQDDGPGIPERIITRIFDPFFTTKEVGKGTGLGLSLAYGIIQEHGGSISARSRPGEGATFVIELPVIRTLQPEPTMFPAMMPQAAHFENLVRGKRVLVVDDEKYILDFFVEAFQAFPMHVDTAGDGSEAMEKLLARDYDLIVTDFKMPQMSGRELFHWIKQQRPALARRIIFITGDTVSPETRSFFESTSSRYIAKPFRIEEIQDVIEQTLAACE
jgi:two-component system NtrC family sensor kinase